MEEEAELRVEATNRRAFLNADFNLELVQRFSILMKPWPPSVDRVYVERFLIYWMIRFRCQCQQRVNYKLVAYATKRNGSRTHMETGLKQADTRQ